MAQFHTHGTPPPVKRRSIRRGTATPAMAAFIAGALISVPAWAGPPDAQFGAVAAGSPGETIRTAGAVSGIIIGDFPDSGGTDSASTTTDLTAHAKGAADSRGSAGGEATIDYYGEVVGSSTSPVPLSIVGFLSTQFGAGAVRRLAVAAQLRHGLGNRRRFRYVRPPRGSRDSMSSPTPCGSASLSVNAVFDAEVGQIFEVALQAQAWATNGALAVASVDPEISILPDFLAANPGLSLEFSANITQPGSVGSVPESSTWALLALGFAGLALASHRRPAHARKGAGA